MDAHVVGSVRTKPEGGESSITASGPSDLDDPSEN